MAILGISSATKILSVGICENSNTLAELIVSGKESFTEDLIVYIEKLIEQAKVKITGIAVASGPGSYNGLRGGMATAKTLAQIFAVPIAQVSTLEAIAFNLINVNGTILSLSDARRDEYNIALFASYQNNLKRITNDLLMKLEDIKKLLSKIKGEIYVCSCNEEIQSLFIAKNIRFAIQNFSIPRGSNVAIIGEKLIKEGKDSNLMKLTPNYSVEPNIREFKKGVNDRG